MSKTIYAVFGCDTFYYDNMHWWPVKAFKTRKEAEDHADFLISKAAEVAESIKPGSSEAGAPPLSMEEREEFIEAFREFDGKFENEWDLLMNYEIREMEFVE